MTKPLLEEMAADVRRVRERLMYDGRLNIEKMDEIIAKQCLASVLERLQSDEVVERIALAIGDVIPGNGGGYKEAFTTEKYPGVREMLMDLAKGAIAGITETMKGEGNE